LRGFLIGVLLFWGIFALGADGSAVQEQLSFADVQQAMNFFSQKENYPLASDYTRAQEFQYLYSSLQDFDNEHKTEFAWAAGLYYLQNYEADLFKGKDEDPIIEDLFHQVKNPKNDISTFINALAKSSPVATVKFRRGVDFLIFLSHHMRDIDVTSAPNLRTVVDRWMNARREELDATSYITKEHVYLEISTMAKVASKIFNYLQQPLLVRYYDKQATSVDAELAQWRESKPPAPPSFVDDMRIHDNVKGLMQSQTRTDAQVILGETSIHIDRVNFEQTAHSGNVFELRNTRTETVYSLKIEASDINTHQVYVDTIHSLFMQGARGILFNDRTQVPHEFENESYEQSQYGKQIILRKAAHMWCPSLFM
jgi:hypothetical protein